jgi:hypothetical protein
MAAQQQFGTPFVIRTNEVVTFPEGLTIRFLSHSHKRTMAGGPSSPLIIYMDYELGNEKQEQHQRNLQVDEGDKQWTWKQYRFELVDYRYGDWMKLVVQPEEAQKVAN